MPDMNSPISPSLSDEDLMTLYSERRLAEMKPVEAWFYRRYRRLSPRARMFVGRVSTIILAGLAGIGVAAIVIRPSYSSVVVMTSMLIGTAIGAVGANTIPFRYR